MSDEPALLVAIRAHPDEDTPRLIYADWLDENGRPDRAEFIRIQCAPDADEVARDRAAELQERNYGKWLAGLPRFSDTRWDFHRGFPEHLDVPGELMLERYEAFVRVPWLRFLVLHEMDNSAVRDFLNRSWNPRWVELELLEGFSEDPDADATPAVLAVSRCPQVHSSAACGSRCRRSVPPAGGRSTRCSRSSATGS